MIQIETNRPSSMLTTTTTTIIINDNNKSRMDWIKFYTFSRIEIVDGKKYGQFIFRFND